MQLCQFISIVALVTCIVCFQKKVCTLVVDMWGGAIGHNYRWRSAMRSLFAKSNFETYESYAQMLKIRPISKQVDIVPGCIRKSNVQGGKKYFPSWEPRFLGQYFARDSVIPEPAVALQNLIHCKNELTTSIECWLLWISKSLLILWVHETKFWFLTFWSGNQFLC